MENGVQNPFYSEIHSQVLHDSQGFRNPQDDQEQDNQEEKKARTRIPVSKFKQTAEKVKEQRRSDTHEKQTRRSSIPKLKDKPTQETKQPKADLKDGKSKVDKPLTSAVENKVHSAKNYLKHDKPKVDNPMTGSIEMDNNIETLNIDITKAQHEENEQFNKNIKNTNIPFLVKKKVEKFRQNRDSKKGDSNTKVEEKNKKFEVIKASDKRKLSDSDMNKMEGNKSNLVKKSDDPNNIERANIEINAEEQQVIDDFDKIYEDIGDSEEPDSIIDEIVEKTYVDPEKLETKFDKIVNDYDEKKSQPIHNEKVKSKIPLMKQKSLHEVPVPKIADRRHSLKNININDDNSNNVNSDYKDIITIDNKAPLSEDPSDLKNKKHIQKNYKPSTSDVKLPNAIKQSNKQTLVDEEIKTANNIEIVQYDNNIIVTEELQLEKGENRLKNKKSIDRPVKEIVNISKPIFDKTNAVNNIKLIDNDINLEWEGKVEIKIVEEVEKKPTSNFDKIKTVDTVKTINDDNVLIQDEKKKPEVKPVKETVKVVTPVSDDIKTLDSVETIQYDNNVIVTDEIKTANSYTDPVNGKEPIHIEQTQISKEEEKALNTSNDQSLNTIKENEKVEAMLEEIKQINNVETIEYNNNIVTEEVKVINSNKKNKPSHKTYDNLSKMPDSTKMVQSLLSQMGNKTKQEIPDSKSNEGDYIIDKSITDKEKCEREENKIDAVSVQQPESKLHKLINKIKTKDHESKNQETNDTSIKSKIAAFNKNKITKPTPIFKPRNDSELNKIEQTHEIKEDLPNGNNNPIDIINETKVKEPAIHEKIKHDRGPKETKLDTVEQKVLKSSNNAIDSLKDFNEYITDDNKDIIEEKEPVTIDKQAEVETSDDLELENEIEDYIPMGKESSIINKIGSRDNKESSKPGVIIDVPKKKSVLSRIAMFEQQASKEPVKPRQQFVIKAKDVPALVTTKPKIIDEIQKTDNKENLEHSQESNKNHDVSVNKESAQNKQPTKIDSEKKYIEETHNLKQNSKKYRNDKPKLSTASNIIAKFERSIEKRNLKQNNNTNVQIKKDYDEKDFKLNKNDESILVNKENELQKDVTGDNNVEESRKHNKSQSLVELDLGNVVKGKVKQIIVRINSKENLYQEFEKKEAIDIKELPRKRTVSERIALFEKKITPISTEEPIDLSPPTTTKIFFQSTDSTPSIESTTCIKNTKIEGPVAETTAPSISTEKIELRTRELTEEELRKKIEDLKKAKRRYGSVIEMPTIKLSNGQEMPVLAVGSALVNESLLPHIIKAAIDLGYRAFDTAYIYGNEKAIGEAIRQKIDEGVVRRDQLFLINKLWSTFHRTDLVETACRSSLETMGLEYFDLYLVHNPMSFKEGSNPLPKIANVVQYSESDYMNAWYGMEELVKKGLTKSIGLSNFNSTQVVKVYDKSIIKPVINQVESHPYLTQYPLESVCADRNIMLSCFGTLGSKGTPQSLRSYMLSAIDDPLLITMAAGLNMTTAQLLIRYQIDRGHNVVVKASSAAHLWDNLQALNYRLDDTHISAIDALNRNKRTFAFTGMGDTHRNYPFRA